MGFSRTKTILGPILGNAPYLPSRESAGTENRTFDLFSLARVVWPTVAFLKGYVGKHPLPSFLFTPSSTEQYPNSTFCEFDIAIEHGHRNS